MSMIFKPGDSFTEKFNVSAEVYNGFIQVFKDTNQLHTDEQFAIGKGFKGRVMHGNILNGFLSYFIGECLPVKNVIIHLQEIQFKHAVYLYDELLLTAMVEDVFESVQAIVFKYNYKNAEGIIVAKGKFQIGIT